jgi:uncharacterized damage-inducible protein DinB
MRLARVLLIVLLLPTAALARMPNAPKAEPAPKRTGFQAEYFANLDEVQDKLLQLAEATPADKFSWRPAPGVRSVSEAYMHVAGGNYFLCTFLGVDPPKGDLDLEKRFTRKAEVIAELRRSFDHLRAAASSAKLENGVKMFGKQTTQRGVLITTLNHLHEHLGQSIAYARMVNVVPPWSR